MTPPIKRSEILALLDAASAAGEVMLREHCKRALGRSSGITYGLPTKHERATSRAICAASPLRREREEARGRPPASAP